MESGGRGDFNGGYEAESGGWGIWEVVSGEIGGGFWI